MVRTRITALLSWNMVTVLAALATALGPRSAAGEIVLDPVIDVQQVAYDFVSLAILEDGSFALAGGYPFQVQVFSPAGVPLGKPYVPSPGKPYGGLGSLGRRYFVSWQRPVYHPLPTTDATFLGSGGEVLARPFRWPDSEIEDYGRYYRYGSPPDEAFLAVTYHQDGLDYLQNPIWVPTLQVYDEDAQPVGHHATIAKAGQDWALWLFDAAINGQGRFAILSLQNSCPPRTAGCPAAPRQTEDATELECIYGMQSFSAAGHALSPLLTEGLRPFTGGCNSSSGPALLAMDPLGSILVLGQISSRDRVNQVGRLFDRDGTPGSPVMLLPGSRTGLVPFKLRAIGAGHFAFVSLRVNDDGSTSILLSDFHIGTGFSEPIEVSQVTVPGATLERGPLFEITASGRGLVAWATVDDAGAFHGFVRPVHWR